MNAIVIVHFDESGELSYHVCGGEAVRLYIVDERAPNDRVYEWLERCDAADIREIIPEHSEIGSSRDKRHPAIVHRIKAIMEGRNHLRVINSEDTP